MFTLNQEKCKFCPYNNKRYLVADFLYGGPNPNTYAYGHHDLAVKEH